MQTTHSAYPAIILEQAAPYRNIIEGTRLHVLRDGSTGAFSERHIQCVWFDPALRPQLLAARSGEHVVVLDPGRWNREAGPDFLDATLLIKPELRRIRGDVEIHIHPADWEHHRHAGDPRYSRVIAHVTFFPGLGSPAGLPPGTLEIALEDALTQNPAFRMERIDTSAYPFAARLQQCACGILLQEQDNVDPLTLLHAAGCFRFEQKAHAMATAMRHGRIEDLLYHKTMAALGYKQHTQAFARLAALVPLATIQQHTALEAYAILMGTAGLLPATFAPSAPPGNQKFVRQLWDIWWQYRADTHADSDLDWNGPSGRPANHPARRLAAAATLFSQPDPWGEITRACNSQKGVRALRDLFWPTGPLAFWLNHTTFEQSAASHTRALVGNDRLAAWINNVILPMAAATGKATAELLPLFMPEQINAVARQTAARLLGRDHNPALYRKAGILQQGLVQIFQDFCSSGCHDCRLAETLRQGTFGASA